ncbi:Na+/H+ antiporter NhaA [Allosaccharopolyspora coralli]|uniref:Na(+)/H(+) antiporter NhaA n=1 Tax=Allosaccharopolyspora coralli TaxID=2665642 RepID=A0A5Q3Q3W4_9PSEU|nr:Na+/H+ antiporter NhaA [Allosaccharopolyspora coralli]QGK69132.1 Na+/H+ antiporter NhaA [Allosaccharopolyspora coralli]
MSVPPEKRRTVPARPQLDGQFTASLRRFASTESNSAGLLLAATVLALLWANSPWSASYSAFWETPLAMRLGDAELNLDLRHWVNDGLMVFFFFVVGLEVKREIALGELSSWRRSAVPLCAAITGLLLPAVLFLALNPSGEQAAAWGVVISTDTAFVLGALALTGRRQAARLRIFLLALAVADDVGALSIIALFYTERISLVALALAVAGLVSMLVLRRFQVWRGPAYFVLGVGIWLATYESGVHPTIAGVVIALFVTAHPPRREHVEDAAKLTRAYRQSPNPEFARQARLGIERSVAPNDRLQRLYQPWSSFVIVPIFALANAGIAIDGEIVREALQSRLTLGVVLGLVVGKFVGVSLGALAAVRLRFGAPPPGVGATGLAGAAALSGIGFTISLFIVDLALDDPELADEARLGVLAGSLLAAVLGWSILRASALLAPRSGERKGPPLLNRPVDPDRDHVRGRSDAPLTLVEFADFECPFCGRATGMIAELRAHYGDRLRYVFRHMPLTDVHEHAELAAHAAEAAGAQGQFWEMFDLLFARADALGFDDLVRHAQTLDLDLDRFVADLQHEVHAARVHDDLADAQASGAGGTPTFYVNGRRHDGPHDAASLVAALDAVAPETRS